jgi:predicted GIY-YIG superfamily endonuclease
LPASAGGGYGFQFRTPEGHGLNIASDVAQHRNAVNDRSRPLKVAHVVLNSARIEEQSQFLIDLLGFRRSDTTQYMDFIRCCADHHSIAFARANGPTLNHVAYEMENIDGLMRGAGRLKSRGFDIEWGVGRHGPGNNVFSYFVEPNGFVVEYTTEVEQVDEAEYIPHDAAYWASFPGRPCRWGMATNPSTACAPPWAATPASPAKRTASAARRSWRRRWGGSGGAQTINMPYHVYILASRRYGTLYIGVTNNLRTRVKQHQLGFGSAFVRKHGVHRLVYVETYEQVEDAIRARSSSRNGSANGRFN